MSRRECPRESSVYVVVHVSECRAAADNRLKDRGALAGADRGPSLRKGPNGARGLPEVEDAGRD